VHPASRGAGDANAIDVSHPYGVSAAFSEGMNFRCSVHVFDPRGTIKNINIWHRIRDYGVRRLRADFLSPIPS
jgi:hypothetical protein